MATPLIVSFKLLLCIFLESIDVYGHTVVDLKIVFLLLLAFVIVVLVDNFRMCKALFLGDEEIVNDEAIWKLLFIDNYIDLQTELESLF